jgi:hypothetical protein
MRTAGFLASSMATSMSIRKFQAGVSALACAADAVGVFAHDLDHKMDRHANWLGEPNLAAIDQRDRMLGKDIRRQAFQCWLSLGEKAGQKR